jgi:hypothetical protein
MKIVWQRNAGVDDYFVIGPESMISEIPDTATTEDIEWYLDVLNHVSVEDGVVFQNADGYRPVGRLDDILNKWEFYEEDDDDLVTFVDAEGTYLEAGEVPRSEWPKSWQELESQNLPQGSNE